MTDFDEMDKKAEEAMKAGMDIQRWAISDEFHVMTIATRIAPTMPDAPTDDIAKRAAGIVAAVRARFVQGEGS